MPRGLNRHILLAFEMMEERALGDAGSGAKLVHRGGVIALFADHAQRHVQQADAGVPAFGCGFTTRHGRTIPTGWYARKELMAMKGHAARLGCCYDGAMTDLRSEEHTSELQSLMRNSYAVFCLKTKKQYRQK